MNKKSELYSWRVAIGQSIRGVLAPCFLLAGIITHVGRSLKEGEFSSHGEPWRCLP